MGEYIGQYSDNSASQLRAMGQLMNLPKDSTVIDAGCGTAAIACFFAVEFGWRITGVDISTTHLKLGSRRVESRGLDKRVNLVASNLYDVKAPRKFDGVYGTGAWCHFEKHALFRKCRSLLRGGGVLAFMERIRLDELTAAEFEAVTAGWYCPDVCSSGEYVRALEDAGFVVSSATDLSGPYRDLQMAQVGARLRNRKEIIAATSQTHFETSFKLAAYESDLTRAGKLGYAMFVAKLEHL